jgi:hypothetical protein
MTQVFRALVLLAAMTPGAPALAQDGAAAWQRQCSDCHASVARVMRRLPAGSAESRADWLSHFLAGHHAPDPAVRSAIVAWLLER